MMSCLLCRARPFASRSAAIAFVFFFLAACDRDARKVEPATVSIAPPGPVVVTVGGDVVAGLVAGATVNVFAVDASGAKIPGPIASAVTDASGLYTIRLVDFVGVYLVEATGGAYVDEATGETLSIPATAPLRAVSTVAAAGTTATITATVTPLTEVAVQVAQAKSGGLTPANVTSGNDQVGALFFGNSPDAGAKLLAIRPAVITDESSATATDDARLYGLMLAAISQVGVSKGSVAAAVTEIAADVSSSGGLAATSGSLIAAAATIASSPANNSGVSSSAVVSNILTAAASGAGTQVALSSESEITSFSFPNTLIKTINKTLRTVTLVQPAGTSLAALTSPTIATSLGSTITPVAGQNFAQPVQYIVTAQDGTASTWIVTASLALSTASPLANITGASSSLVKSLVINSSAGAILGTAASLADLAALDQVTSPASIFSVSAGATIQQLGGTYAGGDVLYSITAADGATIRQWTALLKVTAPQSQPVLSITNGNLSRAINASPVQLSTSGGLAEAPLSYSSSNTSVATVSTGGLVSIVGAGSSTLTATRAATSTAVVSYLETSASVSLTVTKLAQTALAFAVPSVSVTTKGSIANAVSGGSGTGAVSYSSSDPLVATVNSTGGVTIVGVGVTTMSASKAGDATFLVSNTATFALTITPVPIEPPVCVIDQASWDNCIVQ